jgi:hypothetical protein
MINKDKGTAEVGRQVVISPHAGWGGRGGGQVVISLYAGLEGVWGTCLETDDEGGCIKIYNTRLGL